MSFFLLRNVMYTIFLQYFYKKNPKWQVTIDEEKCNLSDKFKLK